MQSDAKQINLSYICKKTNFRWEVFLFLDHVPFWMIVFQFAPRVIEKGGNQLMVKDCMNGMGYTVRLKFIIVEVNI